MSPPWVLVSPGFHRQGGMEKANHAVAEHLALRGTEVHLVGHSIDPELKRVPGVHWHPVARPIASFLLAEGSLARRGRAVAKEVSSSAQGARVLVNGGNCNWGDLNWVHFVHHAWTPVDRGAPLLFRVKNRVLNLKARRDELQVIPRAKLVISNSLLTTSHVVDHLGVQPEVVRTVYLGAEASWGSPSPEERRAAREWLGAAAGQPVVSFVGALGFDSRKGFDTLLRAWQELSEDPAWDGMLVAAGGGRGIGNWQRRVGRMGLDHSVRMLGFTRRVADLLAASDLLVSPVRYEAYGLNVQEALCRGVPAIVSGSAGIAERYSGELRRLILRDPEDATELARLIREWRRQPEQWREWVHPLGQELRSHSWADMARQIVDITEQGLGTSS